MSFVQVDLRLLKEARGQVILHLSHYLHPKRLTPCSQEMRERGILSSQGISSSSSSFSSSSSSLCSLSALITTTLTPASLSSSSPSLAKLSLRDGGQGFNHMIWYLVNVVTNVCHLTCGDLELLHLLLDDAEAVLHHGGHYV